MWRRTRRRGAWWNEVVENARVVDQRNRELQGALVQYGRHEEDCEREPCTCGFEAAIAHGADDVV